MISNKEIEISKHKYNKTFLFCKKTADFLGRKSFA